MQKSAYGLNHAPRRWWQVADKALLSYGLVPTRADRCTYILFGDQKTSISVAKGHPQKDLNLEQALEFLMNASVRNNSKGRKAEGFICLHVDDLYMAGSPEFQKPVLSKILKDFNVGSEDKNDLMFVGQRKKWEKHDKHGSFISCDQKLAVDQLEEIKVDKQMKDNLTVNRRCILPTDPFLVNLIVYRVEPSVIFVIVFLVMRQRQLVQQ